MDFLFKRINLAANNLSLLLNIFTFKNGEKFKNLFGNVVFTYRLHRILGANISKTHTNYLQFFFFNFFIPLKIFTNRGRQLTTSSNDQHSVFGLQFLL